MPAVPFNLQFYVEVVGQDNVEEETVVNKRTNEQLSVATHRIIMGERLIKVIEVKRNRALKKKAKNSQIVKA